MGFSNSGGSATIKSLKWDADLIVPAIYKITTDHIAETTAGHGIITAAAFLTTDHIAETTAGHGVTANSKSNLMLWG